MNPTQSPKALWAAIGVLVVAVAALGGVLVYQQGRDATPPAGAVSSASSVQPVRAPEDHKPAGLAATASPAPPVVGPAAPAVPPPPLVSQPPPVRAPATASPQMAQAEPAPAPACAVCGRVESVRATAYEVRVRMDNGSLRTVETRTAPPIGKAVTLKGKVLRPADGQLRTAPGPAPSAS